MSGATLAAALPAIAREFSDVDRIDLLVRLVLTLPALFIAVTAPLAGRLADQLGRRNLLMVCLVLYAIGGTSGFFLDDLYLILAGRALLGISIGGVMTVTVSLVGDYFTGDERNSFLSIQSAFMALGGLIFLSLGGVLADISWRYPFCVYAFSLMVLLLAYFFLPEPTKTNKRASTFTEKLPLLAWFIYLAALFGIIGFYIVPVQLPFYLEEKGVTSATTVGIVLGMVTLSAAIASLLYTRLRQFVGYRQVILLSFTIMGISYSLVSIMPNYWTIAIVMFISGLGAGLVMPNSNVWLLAITPERIRGQAVGGLTSAIFLGQFLSPIMTAPLITLGGLSGIFLYGGIIMVILGGIFFMLCPVFGKKY